LQITNSIDPATRFNNDLLRHFANGEPSWQQGQISDELQAQLTMALPDICAELIARRAAMMNNTKRAFSNPRNHSEEIANALAERDNSNGPLTNLPTETTSDVKPAGHLAGRALLAASSFFQKIPHIPIFALMHGARATSSTHVIKQRAPKASNKFTFDCPDWPQCGCLGRVIPIHPECTGLKTRLGAE